MKRYIWGSFAALSAAIFICLGILIWRAHRASIIVRLGSSELPALAPPPAPPSAAPDTPYTNEQLQALLQKEGLALGIDGIAAPGERTEQPEGFLGPRLGSPGSRAQAEIAIQQLNMMRRALDAGHKKPTVPIYGKTAPLLAAGEAGGESIREPAGAAAAAAPGAWSGSYGGVPAGTFMVSDGQKWREVWSALSPDPPPSVDFSRQQVAAVFLGYRPTGGFRVEIAPDVSAGAEALTVRYREISPVPGRTPPEGATAPFALRVVPRNDLPIRFERIR